MIDALGYALTIAAFGCAVALVTVAEPPRNRRVTRARPVEPEAPRNVRVTHAECPRGRDCARCAAGVARCRGCERAQCAIALRDGACTRCGRRRR